MAMSMKFPDGQIVHALARHDDLSQNMGEGDIMPTKKIYKENAREILIDALLAGEFSASVTTIAAPKDRYIIIVKMNKNSREAIWFSMQKDKFLNRFKNYQTNAAGRLILDQITSSDAEWLLDNAPEYNFFTP